MENIENTIQNAAPIESEKTTTWGIRLRESEKIKVNELLESIGGDKKETLLDVLSKAAVEHQSQQATTGIIAEMETYTKAIMQAALRQATAAAAVETATKAKYDELLDIEQDAKLKLLEQVEALKAQIVELKETIKAQKGQISDAADTVEKQKEEIYCLKNDLDSAQRNAAAVAEIQKEYSSRLKAAEAAKAAAEKTAADALTTQQAAEKATAEANNKAANLSAEFNAANSRLEELQKQLDKAEARAEKAEERADKLLEKALAATQHTKKAAAKATHTEDGSEFEKALEEKGQQKLVHD